MRQTLRIILDTYASISEFVPPKIIVSLRENRLTDQLAAELYDLFTVYPQFWYTFNHDGTQWAERAPFLIIFRDEFASGPPLPSPGSALWLFNRRYTNGWLLQRGVTTPIDWGSPDENRDHPAWRVRNDWPYWNYIENSRNFLRPGYYQTLYRGLPAPYSGILEQSAIWVALYLCQPPFELCELSLQNRWDGMFAIIDGRWPIQRTADTVLAHRPRITVVNRFNYPMGWFYQPQEGLSLNFSTIIEPIEPPNPSEPESAYAIFDGTTDVVHSIRLLTKIPPGKPIIKSVEGNRVSFSSSNMPTRYRVSATPDTGSWKYININLLTIGLPPELIDQPFYIQTKNSFGVSEITRYP